MPLFLTDEEFERCSHDPILVAEKADAFIRQLYNQLETVKAQADAASITAEQTCSLLEQKYVSLSSEFSALQSQQSQFNSSLDQRLSELAQLQADKHQLHLLSIGKDGEIERLSTEVSELHKSKRQLMELLENKDLEISEKNATIKSYLDKIVTLSDNAASKEARLSDLESELARSQASCSQLLQEKELIERHNTWLNDELTTKVNDLINLRKTHSKLEADMSVKLSDVERKFSESSSSLTWYKDRVRELESKLSSLEQELLSSKDAASRTEEQSSAEISTLNKLVELYKESSEEWSKKAGELESVIKALEAHSNQIETDYKEKLEKEVSTRKELEEALASLKEKLVTCEAELEKSKVESKTMPLSSLSTELFVPSVSSTEMIEDDRWLVPSIPAGVSGTALAASLLRDGWSLVKIYTKYQEAVDALRHEQLGRKQSQAILERVLHEIEEKAGIILDEREEHERLVEGYSALDEKLKHSLSEKATLESKIEELKADLRRCERDYVVAQRENLDLQKQVTLLLKECRDIQLRCGSVEHKNVYENMAIAESDVDNAESLLSFKDISGLVEQNAQLRSLVRNLTYQIETTELEWKDKFEKELQKQIDDASSKVNAILARADEQGRMVESLHTSVAMYKKLYEEEHRLRTSDRKSPQDSTEVQRTETMILTESSQGVSQKAQEHKLERLKCIEDELVKLRSEVISLRSERDKSALEAQFAQGKLDRFLKEFEHMREEHNAVLSRNVEFSQLIVDYQKKLRENSESCTAAEELSRKLKMEVSILKHEKEILVSSEKRASDEVRSLSERVHRLQASLDTIQSTEEVREEARGAERRKQEEYIKHIEKEWAEAKKELQEERNNVRNLTLVRENDLKSALRQVEEMGKELANTLHSLSMVESRAAVAEARAADLEEKLQSSHTKISDINGGSGPSSSSSEKIFADLCTAQEEIKNLREEVKFCKDHMLQYKSIAQANEEALKQMELSHENFKVEADNMKNSLEEEILLLRKRAKELEGECDLRTKEAASANAGKDEELAAAFSEIAHLKEDCCLKMSQIGVMEIQISSLKDDLEKEHQRWRAAQANYERQVILQSETIQELTRTSQALASLQEETSELHKMSDALKSENIELKAKWDAEKKELEELKSEADKKFNEVNEQNKILLSRLEAIHIKQAEKDRVSAGISSGTTATEIDDGLLNVVNYLRRSKEIGETEISLLKQERLRLQSQLENALKAAETAEASYRAERESSKALLYREEEFKGLQLQVRELNLLRESNLQLREENRHNFEECQKLRETAQKARSEADNLEKFLKDREHEVEAFRKEADIQRMEKQHLEKRIDELVEKCKSFDVEDYERVREAVRQMQETLKEKDDQLEEIRKHVSERQELISKLEQDLSRNRVELSQRESRINELLQAEASLRSELDKMKRSTNLHKKKFENLVKEKDELNKENQVLLKNLEEARQGRRNVGDAITEQALKEKEKEKDTRIQMLEKTLERHREELKREKEEHRTEKARRLKTQRACTESIETVKQQQSKLTDELEKHKQALKMFTDEGEKSRQPKGGQSEGTSVDQLLAGTRLADFTAAYLQAVNNFEQVVQPICIEAGVSTAADISSGPEISLSSGPAVSLVLPTSLSTISSLTKTEDEREKRLVSSKMSSETRKTGRKLVRPRILKPEEPHDDIEMQEVDATASSGKPLASHAVETQENPMPTSQPSVRKRPSATSTSELQEETPTSEEASTHVQPVLKKPKGPETSQEGGEVKSVVNFVPESVLATEEYDVGDLTQGFKEEDDEKDEAGSGGEQGEDVSVDTINQANLQNDRSDVVDDILDRSGETAIQDDQLNFQVQQDIHQTAIESGSEKEEGELVADITDIEGGSNLSMGSPDVEGQSEQTVTPENLTGVDEDPFISLASETGEVDSSRVLDDEKTDGGEELVEVQDKMNDGSDRVMAETDQVPESALTTSEKPSTSNNPVVDLKEENPGIATDTEEATQSTVTSRSSTTINLMERARERARERQGQHTTLAHPSAPTRARGRLHRGRQVRGGRSGRGQTPG
ncbi:PREDICTED: nuclear-pore anchor isoform X2 [Ipomoea nil]|uniref:nuclear-pore anchor isoform X2 n=1 Tax=Ipomoea nil TaxID=35883 RepID=UPI0009015AFE|nr:PREDICTED: nuclear-pore anchor isoform X2 [Ipomoea nil]